MEHSDILAYFDSSTRKNLETWLSPAFPPEVSKAVREMIEKTPEVATDSFYSRLTFGTGGLRGLMGLGSNCINIYTIAFATQGLANYIQQKKFSSPCVFIGYDSRHLSRQFAETTAKVLAANQIRAILSYQLCPTPFASFACRQENCHAAIVITASHNPKDYNGYKIYWSDGAQIIAPHDEAILKEINKVLTPLDVKEAHSLDHPLIEETTDRLEKLYVHKIAKDMSSLVAGLEPIDLKIVYTPLNGTGICLVPPLFQKLGLPNPIAVPEQNEPNGDFPTTPKPNPEEDSTLSLGTKLLEEVHGDILIATDPDADRMRVVVNHQGRFVPLNGNQIGELLLYFICDTFKERGLLPHNPVVVKTIVTSTLFAKIAESFNIPCVDVLTGFKFIAEKIREYDESRFETFLFGAEESYGYLKGTLCRDKDGVQASALIALLTWKLKTQKKTLIDLLEEFDRRFGSCRQRTVSVTFPESKSGRNSMILAMRDLREKPPTMIGKKKVEHQVDYLFDETLLPKTDVIRYELEGGSSLIVRPSGTEPKIKLYAETFIPFSGSKESTEHRAESACLAMIDDLKARLQNT